MFLLSSKLLTNLLTSLVVNAVGVMIFVSFLIVVNLVFILPFLYDCGDVTFVNVGEYYT